MGEKSEKTKVKINGNKDQKTVHLSVEGVILFGNQ